MYVANKVNPNKPPPRCIIIKMAKARQREDSKDSKRKPRVNCKGTKKTCCSPEESDEIVKVVKGENLASTQEDYHLE